MTVHCSSSQQDTVTAALRQEWSKLQPGQDFYFERTESFILDSSGKHWMVQMIVLTFDITSHVSLTTELSLFSVTCRCSNCCRFYFKPVLRISSKDSQRLEDKEENTEANNADSMVHFCNLSKHM